MKLTKNDKNLKEISSLIKYAFNKNKNPEQDSNFLSRYDHSKDYGVVNDDKIVNYLMVNIFNSRVFTKRTKMAGIGYVSSVKEARGKGNITKLMREALLDLHQKSIPYANLAPFSERFYRQYGFENTIYQKIYSFNKEALNFLNSPKEGSFKAGSWKDLIVQNGAAQLYEVPLHTTEERNTMNRPFWWWNRLEKYYPGRKLVVFYGRVGLPQAYMFYRMINGICQVDELYADAGDGIRGLLSYLKDKVNSDHFKIIMPAESHLEDYFPEQQLLTIKIKTYMMSRIIDFAKVLSYMKLIHHVNAIIQVTADDICPWNIGTWQITFDKDGYRLKKIEAKADFSGSINAWTKVLLGELTLKQAIMAGEIKGNKNSKLDFAKGTVTFYDYF